MERHVRFLRMHLRLLSQHYISLDTSRMTALCDALNQIDDSATHLSHRYFCVAGLKCLGARIEDPASAVEWIYSRQVPGGFSETAKPHLASTFSALSALRCLGDDLRRVDSAAILSEIATLIDEEGSVAASVEEPLRDTRFCYCACAIAKLLGSKPNPAVGDFVERCQAYDGGFGLIPGGESHGGSTFCAIAALKLLGRHPTDNAIHWCLRRFSTEGVQGRVNKAPDTCYSFWIGASLKALGVLEEFIEPTSIDAFLTDCEHAVLGGFAKSADAHPDLLHTFYSIAWLSWQSDLDSIDPLLAVPTSCLLLADR